MSKKELLFRAKLVSFNATRHSHLISFENHTNFIFCFSGTGKSLIIKYLTELLDEELGNDSYVLAAPTGVAAILINGKTLHSIFKLPRKSKEYKPLTGEAALNLTNKLQNVKYLILDEYSLIGCKTLAMINRRCKEAKGNSDEDFAGLHVMLLGDVKQLPRVKDNSFVSKIQQTALGLEGKALIMNFQKTFVLTTCHRQKDQLFLNLLNNISEGKITHSDYELLKHRFRTNVNEKERMVFEDAIRLFGIKEDVKDYNLQKLRKLKDATSGMPVPVAKITAKHNCSDAKKASSDSAEGLERRLYLAKGSRIMLRNNLWLDQRLCNGSLGKVIDIIYDKDNEFPSVILCEFDSYQGPSMIPGVYVSLIEFSTLEHHCHIISCSLQVEKLFP